MTEVPQRIHKYRSGSLFFAKEYLQYFLFMQVFLWSQQAGNYAFLESRDQCLHVRLEAVASSRPVGESR